MRAAVVAGALLVGASAWLLLHGDLGPGVPEGPDPVEDATGGWVTGLPGSFALRPGVPARSPIGQIGYASGSEAPPPRTGVTLHGDAAPTDWMTVLCHGDAAAAELLDPSGEVRHRWALPYDELPDAPALEGDHQRPWRAVELLPDGGLIAIHSGRAMVRVDRDSNLIWARYERFHHEAVAVDGSRGLALRRIERIVPAVQPDEPIVDDLLVRFDLDTGRTIDELSLWDALEASPFSGFLERLNVRQGDIMHANGIATLPPAFCEALGEERVGPTDLLVSMRDLDLVVAVDMETRRIDWLTQGPADSPWRGLHDPTPWVDSEGHARLLVFDNLGGSMGTSRLLELEFPGALVHVPHSGRTPGDFHSLFCGTVERFPGGALLTAESMAGRVHVIDPDSGEVLWQYASPHLFGDDDRYVAAVFQASLVLGLPDWVSAGGQGR